MIRINLLPYRAARIKENIKRQVTVYALSTILLILVISWWSINLDKDLKSKRQQRNDKNKELASYRDISVKIKALEQTKDQIDIKLEKINELKRVKTGPVKLLDDIAMSVPKDKLWLTAFKERRGTLVLEGTAMDNETVADFMNSLKGTESVTSVELVRTRQKEIKELNLNLKDFALNCTTYAFKEKGQAQPKVTKKKGRR